MMTANNVMKSFETIADIFKEAVLENTTVMNALRKNSNAQLTHTGNVFSCKDASGNPMKLEYTVTVRRIK
mgnify:CR=1 FL=1